MSTTTVTVAVDKEEADGMTKPSGFSSTEEKGEDEEGLTPSVKKEKEAEKQPQQQQQEEAAEEEEEEEDTSIIGFAGKRRRLKSSSSLKLFKNQVGESLLFFLFSFSFF